MSWMLSERRYRRSHHSHLALRYQLEHARTSGGLEALVLADQTGLCLAAAGEQGVREELAAVAPLMSRTVLGLPMPPLLRGAEVAVICDEVAFWHRPAPQPFTEALDEFLQLDPGVQRWLDASFEPTLQAARERFEATGTEEGQVMATILAYVIGDLRTSRRAAILEDFRHSGKILDLFKRGLDRSSLSGDEPQQANVA